MLDRPSCCWSVPVPVPIEALRGPRQSIRRRHRFPSGDRRLFTRTAASRFSATPCQLTHMRQSSLQRVDLRFPIPPPQWHSRNSVQEVLEVQKVGRRSNEGVKPYSHILSALSALSARSALPALPKRLGLTSHRRIGRPAVGVLVFRSQPALDMTSNRASV
jgi:hypothetical protein